MLGLPLFCFTQINDGTRTLLICLSEQHTILGSPVPGPIKSLVQANINTAFVEHLYSKQHSGSQTQTEEITDLRS
jgi:hypothetical protein